MCVCVWVCDGDAEMTGEWSSSLSEYKKKGEKRNRIKQKPQFGWLVWLVGWWPSLSSFVKTPGLGLGLGPAGRFRTPAEIDRTGAVLRFSFFSIFFFCFGYFFFVAPNRFFFPSSLSCSFLLLLLLFPSRFVSTLRIANQHWWLL